jgi:hypothetical protein
LVREVGVELLHCLEEVIGLEACVDAPVL